MSAVVQRLLRWFEKARRDLPWRRTRDAYAIWVSEVMLQQTQVRTVIAYFERWMREFPTLSALAGAEESKVLKLWEGLGYYRRARHLQAAARLIVERHGGVFPRDLEAIRALPGVGRYTAGAIGSIAFLQPVPLVDGNVIRVFARWRGILKDPRRGPVHESLWNLAARLVEAAAATGDAEACSSFNQALMELGATVCTPRTPQCPACPLAGDCAAHRSGNPESYPVAARRPATAPRHFVVVVAVVGDTYGVRQRDAKAVNGGLWEFPNEEVDSAEADPGPVAARLYPGAARGGPLTFLREVRHAITRFRIRQRVYLLRAAPRTRPRENGTVWKTRSELAELPFSAAHRRILHGLASG